MCRVGKSLPPCRENVLLLCPSRWTMNHAPVANRYEIRKLAFRREVARYVSVISCMETKVCGTLVRIEHDYLFVKFVSDEFNRCNEIRISGDYHERLCCVCIGIAKKCCHKIYVGTFFLDLHHMDEAVNRGFAFPAGGIHGWNPCLILVVVPFDYFHSSVRGDGLEVEIVPFNGSRIVGIGLCSGSEILGGDEVMGIVEERANHGREVKPLAFRMPT